MDNGYQVGSKGAFCVAHDECTESIPYAGLAVPPMTTRDQRRHAAMMSRGSAQPVALVAQAGRSIGQVRIERWDPSARTLRAVTRLGILWGLAVLSVLLPVVHFVLVPALLITGPISALARYRQRSGVLGGEGTCPACSAPLEIAAGADEWPIDEVCKSCGAQVRVEKAADASDATTSAAAS
jgi:hypothetical protein